MAEGLRWRSCRILWFLICLVIPFSVLFAPVRAVEFKALGHWFFSVNTGNVYGQRHAQIKDNFQAVQRLRTQFEFWASDSLGGGIQLEMGKTNWGQASTGGALGADSTSLMKLRYAWLDWMFPESRLRIRMGLQNYNMPSFVNGSPIFSEDGAGITISAPLGEIVEATAFWVRGAADNILPATTRHDKLPAFDNMDFFGLAVPFQGDNFRITPYGMYLAAGRNSYGYRKRDNGDEWSLTAYKSSLARVATNIFPVGALEVLANPASARSLSPYTSVWWGGIGGEANFLDALRLSGEFAWGHADSGQVILRGHTYDTRRQGWYAAFLAEYKTDWSVPGVLFWYSSGDDNNPWNGSERMPVGKSANRNWKVLSLAYDGTPFCPDGGAMILSPDGTMIGTWGIVGRFKDVSFIRNLKHELRAGYIRGTNNPAMVKKNPFFTDVTPGGYLTFDDEAIEVDFATTLKICDNLNLVLDGAWLRGNWDENAWDKMDSNLVQDFWRIGLTAYYHF